MTGLTPASSSFHYQWTYDIFINFRGEDTRRGFIGNLYNALKNAGVRTFLDDEELRRGDEITPTLLKSIENSRMAITVFSKNYAFSTFCLNELVKIHECIKGEGRLVWPIFYDVEPSEVRHQKDRYGQALSLHMENLRADKEKICSWKHALHEVANISGDHFNPRQGYEYQFIEKIVKEISSKISRVPLHVSDYPVGLESRVKEITSLLQIGSNDKVVMVGIYGMGGLGKTTIARALYNSIADNFEGLCFVHDVKGKSKKLGLEGIQEIILSSIVGVDIKIHDVNGGVQVIRKRFKEKKILLILDNIDEHEQLKKLAGHCDWFSVGSRIIITTRDKQLLVAHGVESRYDLEVLNAEESLELLRWNAFRGRQVDPCYKDVLNRGVTYAQGLPLALEVIGSNLCGKTINEWESAFDEYKLSPDKGIQKVLRVSYEDLEDVEKEIFLDIACLFNGEQLRYVKYIVEVVHDSNNLSYSIGVLVDKRLIKIEKLDCIEMHDLIRDMGRKIVREESPNIPGKRSRLWLHRDIVDVLERNTGTNKVRMIVQDNWSECIKVNWGGEAFKNMKELKILIFKNVKFSEDPKYLPESLKVLKWGRCPSCLPPNFRSKNLVILDIGYNPSSLEEIIKARSLSYDIGYTPLSSLEALIKTSDNLGILNLEGCKYVKEIPDVSNLRNLKELRLRSCENLIEIHDSVGYLPKLETLSVACCVRLKTFPRAIKLPSLTMLNLERCSSLKYFPEILEKVKMERLFILHNGINKLPWSICNLPKLKILQISSEESVIEIPNSVFLLSEMEHIEVMSGVGKVVSCNSKEGQEHAIGSKQYPNIVEFGLPNCNISDDFLRTDLRRFMNVGHLDLSRNDFTILPAWMKECPFLEKLVLNECRHLREVEGIPPSIRCLEARNCVSLSLESKSIILSKELHEDPLRYSREYYESYFFWLPSRSIPEWFDRRSKGTSISFWFRNKLPTLCLCFLLKPADNEPGLCFGVRVDTKEEPIHGECCVLWSSDNEKPYYLDGDHLIVCCLEEYPLLKSQRERLCAKDRWYHAQFCVWPNEYDDVWPNESDEVRVIEEMGMYVIKQLSEMEDINFTNPYHQTLDSTCGNQEQVDTRMEEKEVAINRKRGLVGDDNFASSSTAFKYTKSARNCPISLNDFDAATPQVSFDLTSTGVKWLSWYPSSQESFADLDFYTTSPPMLPWTENACDNFRNQDKGVVIEEMEMYVIKQLCEREDFSFTNPYHQTLDSLGVTKHNKWVQGWKRKRDDNFALSSASFICTKRARNSLINQDDNDTITPQVPFVKALEIINNDPDDDDVHNTYNDDDDDNDDDVYLRFHQLIVIHNKWVQGWRRKGDDNFASSSASFICSKGARNSPMNQGVRMTQSHLKSHLFALEIINDPDTSGDGGGDDGEDDDIYYEITEITDEDDDIFYEISEITDEDDDIFYEITEIVEDNDDDLSK